MTWGKPLALSGPQLSACGMVELDEREPKAVSKTFWFSAHTALRLLGFRVNFPLVYVTSSQLEYTRMLSSGVDRDRGQLISLVHPLCYRHTAAYVVGTQLVLVD